MAGWNFSGMGGNWGNYGTSQPVTQPKPVTQPTPQPSQTNNFRGFNGMNIPALMAARAAQGNQPQQPQAQPQGNGLSDQSLTTGGYKPGLMQKVGNILPGLVGLKDIDYPMFKGVINITNGRAVMIDKMSLDTKKGSGDKDAQQMGEFAVQRINQILEANGMLDNRSVSGIRVNVGGASGRHAGKASGQLGKGLFVGSTGSFNDGAEHTNLESMADFGTALDKYVTGQIESKTGQKVTNIPQYDASSFTPSNSLGSFDNTSVVGRMLLNAAAAVATGYGISQIASSGAAATGSGLGVAGAPVPGGIVGGLPAAQAANLAAGSVAGGGAIGSAAIDAGTSLASQGATGGFEATTGSVFGGTNPALASSGAGGSTIGTGALGSSVAGAAAADAAIGGLTAGTAAELGGAAAQTALQKALELLKQGLTPDAVSSATGLGADLIANLVEGVTNGITGQQNLDTYNDHTDYLKGLVTSPADNPYQDPMYAAATDFGDTYFGDEGQFSFLKDYYLQQARRKGAQGGQIEFENAGPMDMFTNLMAKNAIPQALQHQSNVTGSFDAYQRPSSIAINALGDAVSGQASATSDRNQGIGDTAGSILDWVL